MVWMVTMKLRPVRIEEKPLIKRPAGIQPASGEGIQNETAADHVDIPAEKIDLREG